MLYSKKPSLKNETILFTNYHDTKCPSYYIDTGVKGMRVPWNASPPSIDLHRVSVMLLSVACRGDFLYLTTQGGLAFPGTFITFMWQMLLNTNYYTTLLLYWSTDSRNPSSCEVLCYRLSQSSMHVSLCVLDLIALFSIQIVSSYHKTETLVYKLLNASFFAFSGNMLLSVSSDSSTYKALWQRVKILCTYLYSGVYPLRS